MSAESFVREFFEILNQRNLDKMENLFNPEAQFYFPKTQPLIGKKRILKFFSILFRLYPQLRFDIQRIIIQGNRAAIHWTNQGKTKRDVPYENEGVTIMELMDGKINFISDFFKDTEKF
jgi:ketosteroid isomerase-like protein